MAVPPMLRPGTIGVTSGELSRYTDFCVALMHLAAPPSTKMVWVKGVDVVGNMNTMCREMEGEWLWIMGDDHLFQPDILTRLLTRDVDVVVPLCLKHSPPYDPVIYSHQNEKGEYVAVTTDLPHGGLHEIHACGSAGMLVKRHVLDAIGDPYFEVQGGLNEDLEFCRKIREAGFRIFVDTDITLGHISIISAWPKWEDDEWRIELQLGNGNPFILRRFLKDDTGEASAAV